MINFGKILDRQYRNPSGLLGRFVGHRMAQDHRPENIWTVSILNAQLGDHVLEIGFGPGFAVQELSKIVSQGRIDGIDFSATMLGAARRRNAAAIRRGQVVLRRGDVKALPFEGNLFDKAFSIHSIYFWPQPHHALREIWRVIKPGGILALTILPKDKWNPEDPTAPVGTRDCRPYSGDELCDMLLEAGFSGTFINSDPNPEHPSNYAVIGVK
jgi:SAM-dependent methyltransferase